MRFLLYTSRCISNRNRLHPPTALSLLLLLLLLLLVVAAAAA
jgi:hypothetical protein